MVPAANEGEARTGTITQPTGAAQQVDKLMAWKPGRGWRVVREHVNEYRGDRAWRGIHDPVQDRFIIPAYFNGLVWVLIGGDGTEPLVTRVGLALRAAHMEDIVSVPILGELRSDRRIPQPQPEAA